MLRTLSPFLSKMLGVVLAAFFVVMTTAFVAVPLSTGGHPGETRIAAAGMAKYHPT